MWGAARAAVAQGNLGDRPVAGIFAKQYPKLSFLEPDRVPIRLGEVLSALRIEEWFF